MNRFSLDRLDPPPSLRQPTQAEQRAAQAKQSVLDGNAWWEEELRLLQELNEDGPHEDRFRRGEMALAARELQWASRNVSVDWCSPLHEANKDTPPRKQLKFTILKGRLAGLNSADFKLVGPMVAPDQGSAAEPDPFNQAQNRLSRPGGHITPEWFIEGTNPIVVLDSATAAVDMEEREGWKATTRTYLLFYRGAWAMYNRNGDLPLWVQRTVEAALYLESPIPSRGALTPEMVEHSLCKKVPRSRLVRPIPKEAFESIGAVYSGRATADSKITTSLRYVGGKVFMAV